MTYSLDLRERVVRFVKKGGRVSTAVEKYEVSESTIRRWLKRQDLKPTKVARRQRKMNWQALGEDVKENPDARLIDRAKKFGVNINAISYALNQMKITRKKRIKVQRKR